MSYYVVSYSDYDSYGPVTVIGPAVEDWQSYCKSLLPEAIERALTGCREQGRKCGNCEIFQSLLDVLDARGYKPSHHPEFCLPGRGIIQEPEDAEEYATPEMLVGVIALNDELERAELSRSELGRRYLAEKDEAAAAKARGE